MNPSNLSLHRLQVRHVTRERNFPPNTCHTNDVSERALPSFATGRADSHAFLCIASSKHRANSCASSCRPFRKVLETALRFFTRPTGATDRPPPLFCNARTMCSPISYTALNPEPPFFGAPYFLCSPFKQKAASGGVCVKHCVTAFRKHVFPRFARPVPTLRTDGHSMWMPWRWYRASGRSSLLRSADSTFCASRFCPLPFPASLFDFVVSPIPPCLVSRTIIRFCASSETSGGSARLLVCMNTVDHRCGVGRSGSHSVRDRWRSNQWKSVGAPAPSAEGCLPNGVARCRA